MLCMAQAFEVRGVYGLAWLDLNMHDVADYVLVVQALFLFNIHELHKLLIRTNQRFF